MKLFEIIEIHNDTVYQNIRNCRSNGCTDGTIQPTQEDRHDHIGKGHDEICDASEPVFVRCPLDFYPKILDQRNCCGEDEKKGHII